MEAWVSSLLAASMRLATPLMLAGVGEVVAERAGVLNLGIEGVMLLSALVSFIVTVESGSVLVGVAAGVGVGVLLGGFHAWMTVHRRTDQIVTGLTMTILGVGLATYGAGIFFRVGRDLPRIDGVPTMEIGVLADIPFVGTVLFGQNLFTYAAWILVLAVAAVLYWTQTGVAIRGIGEDPFAAESLGVDAKLTRILSVVWGGGCAGAAGAFLALGHLKFYTDSIVGGRGFIAIAIVMFGRWNPVYMAGGAFLFGFVEALQLRLQSLRVGIPSELLVASPYALTLLVLILVGRRGQWPAALGIPYARQRK